MIDNCYTACFLGDNSDKEEGGNNKRKREKARHLIDKKRIDVGDDK